MTKQKYTHPKLTEDLRAELLQLGQTDVGKAKKLLATRLGVKKSQRNEWWNRIVSGQVQPVQIAAEEENALVPRQYARPIRRLFWDIETSPNVVLSWRIGYKINLDHSNILKERSIICIGYKWEGDSKVHELHWDESQNDKAMLTEFLKVANEADELVAHNGDKFDMPWFKTRCLFHGLQPPADFKTIDTLQWARRKFYFNSNRLDYIAKFLGLGGKIKTEFGLWKEIVLNKDKRSMDLMLTYCKKDVALLEEVWKKLSTMVRPKTHVGVLGGHEKWTCPYDGSTNVKTSKTKVTANGVVQFQMRCNSCGSYYTISETAHQQYLANKRGI